MYVIPTRIVWIFDELEILFNKPTKLTEGVREPQP